MHVLKIPNHFLAHLKNIWTNALGISQQSYLETWLEKYQFSRRARTDFIQVQIVEFKETKVAVLEHRGDPAHINHSLSTFIQCRQANKLPPSVSHTYNFIYDDPDAVAPEEYRLDICASITGDVKQNAHGVITKLTPEGRCALLRHHGSWDAIGDSARYLHAEWLPDSGEELRDFPCILHFVNLFPEVAEHELLTDIYLPLR